MAELQRQRERHREIFGPVVNSPNVDNDHDGARPKAGAAGVVQVFHMGTTARGLDALLLSPRQ